MTNQRVLPADVYDTLEFVALDVGGIGAGPFVDFKNDCPVCAHGIGAWVEATGLLYGMNMGAIQAALWDAYILPATGNDAAVHRINARKHRRDMDKRVSFQEWCKELNVVRGS